MRFISYEPGPPLGDFVHRFWDSTYTPCHNRVRILPTGTIELVINLSEDEVRIFDGDQPEQRRRLPGIVLSGAYAGALDIDPMRHASMLGVHFRPGGAFRFFGAAIGELANRHLPLEVLWGRGAVELRERLCCAKSSGRRFQILEKALLARLTWAAEHPAVSLALNIFGPAGVGDSVRAAAKRVGLSERRFIQLFTAHVGLTPKLFCRVLRFQHARKVLGPSSTPNWTQLAVTCGYYDQSHLIRDFQQFAGLCPTEYMGRRGNALFPNLIV